MGLGFQMQNKTDLGACPAWSSSYSNLLGKSVVTGLVIPPVAYRALSMIPLLRAW